jgi:hypothetical protein
MRHSYSTSINGEQCTWDIERLWRLAKDLPVEAIPVEDLLPQLETVTCFPSDERLSMKDLARHAVRSYQSDLDYPVILSAEGWLMDGSHRLIKAWMLGLETIKAARFTENPPPDLRERPAEGGSPLIATVHISR